jgi:rod shape determining protein RodA
MIGVVVLSAAALPLVISRLQGYQRTRLITFFNPGSDPSGAGYNILQAKIAVGSGGLFGKGFLTGTQGQLGFVPSRVTDFIFAIFSEEWGFVGGMILLTLFLVVLVRLFRAAHLARDSFGALLAFGVATMIAFQVVVNVGMNIGVMPVVGIPLPFISYGGSSMLTNMAAIGMVQSVVIHHKDLMF